MRTGDHSYLKAIFPLDRPLDRQAFNRFDLKNGGILTALPGKDPDQIRSEHPIALILDEAAFIENGAEAFDIAISSRASRVIVINSAAPGRFRSMTKQAAPTSLEPYLQDSTCFRKQVGAAAFPSAVTFHGLRIRDKSARLGALQGLVGRVAIC